MKKPNNFFIFFYKGIIIGIGTLIPGVSGGTAAMAVGIFEEILESVCNIFSHFKKSVSSLFPISFGALLGILLCSPLISLFCEKLPSISKYTFCIISIISTIFFVKNNIKIDISFKKALCLFSGVLISASVSILTSLFRANLTSDNIVVLFLLGFPLALALVLPAISFSYMMLFLGIYEKTLFALKTLDLIYLLPLSIGIVLGALIFSKLLLRFIEKYNQETYIFVLGFVIFSLSDLLIG